MHAPGVQNARTGARKRGSDGEWGSAEEIEAPLPLVERRGRQNSARVVGVLTFCEGRARGVVCANACCAVRVLRVQVRCWYRYALRACAQHVVVWDKRAGGPNARTEGKSLRIEPGRAPASFGAPGQAWRAGEQAGHGGPEGTRGPVMLGIRVGKVVSYLLRAGGGSW
jgi:hypothetical protein